MNIETNGIKIRFDEKTLAFTFQKEEGGVWKWDKDYAPYLECEEGKILFADAGEIRHQEYRTGTGLGILSTYCGFPREGGQAAYEFQTLVWVETVTQDVFCEWIPVKEEGLKVKKVFWPGPMEFDEKRQDWYTLITQRQGMLIPNTWETALGKLPFDGQLCSAANYMPWFGQVKAGEGYIAICEHPWDCAFW